MGNLITDLIHDIVPDANFVVMNPGGFRAQWTPGLLQYQHFYNMFPFNNDLISFEMTGKEILHMAEVLQSGKNGFYHFWNLLTDVTYDKELNTRSFNSVSWMDGTSIDPEGVYRGVTIDFLLNGGDDFKSVDYKPRNTKKHGDFKTVARPKLEAMESITEAKCIDPDHPRIIVQYTAEE